jgi:FkbM family methyltransferase
MLLDLTTLKNQYSIEISGIIHIGAHHGQEHSLYRSLNIDNLLYIEPLSKNFEILKNSVKAEGVCLQKALGSKTGHVKMYVESANQGMSSSILKPKLHLAQYPHIVFDQEEIVEVDLLDNIDTIKEKSYNAINMDVQGYELEVLKGATETLKSIDVIISEVNRAEVYENCPMVEELDAFLSEYGFERVETNWAGQTWGDALYLKKKKYNS